MSRILLNPAQMLQKEIDKAYSELERLERLQAFFHREEREERVIRAMNHIEQLMTLYPDVAPWRHTLEKTNDTK